MSERRVCRVIGQPRSAQRNASAVRGDEGRLRAEIILLATKYGRYGYRKITTLLQWEGWQVNHKRVERIWREEGLKVPKKQPKRKKAEDAGLVHTGNNSADRVLFLCNCCPCC
jgi:transposase InsO family protein